MKFKRHGHWLTLEDIDPSQYFGFVYFVKNTITDQKYIGKKQYWLKNGKSKSTVTDRTSPKWVEKAWKESNWKEYTSSCKYLNEDIKKEGKGEFIFIILHQWRCKADLHYAEIKEQVQRNVLHGKLESDNTRRVYYNGQIAGMRFLPPTSHSEETKRKISTIVKDSIHVTDGVVNKRQHRSKDIPNGWKRGLTRGVGYTDKARATRTKNARQVIAERVGKKSYNELRQSILDMIESGNTISSVASVLGISRRSVARIRTTPSAIEEEGI